MTNINVHNLVRGTTKPYPGAFTYNKKNRKIKILETKIVRKNIFKLPTGKVKKLKRKIYIKCKFGLVQVISHSAKLHDGEMLQ
jgi:methionyl-tRNA formyltransferase